MVRDLADLRILITGASGGIGRCVAEQAARAGARRLVLTHVPPWTDPQVNLVDARAVYDGPVELAVPRKSYEI